MRVFISWLWPHGNSRLVNSLACQISAALKPFRTIFLYYVCFMHHRRYARENCRWEGRNFQGVYNFRLKCKMVGHFWWTKSSCFLFLVHLSAWSSSFHSAPPQWSNVCPWRESFCNRCKFKILPNLKLSELGRQCNWKTFIVFKLA